MITILLIMAILLLTSQKRKQNVIGNFKSKTTNDQKKLKRMEKGVYRLLYKYTKLDIDKFILALFMMLIVVGISLITPILLGYAVTVLSEASINVKKIVIIIVIYVVILLISFIIQYFQAVILAKAGDHIVYKMREDVFTKLESLSINQLNETPVGKLVTRVTTDTSALNDMYTSTIVNLIKNILTIIGVIIVMLVINFKLTLWILVTTPVVAVLSYIFRKLARKIYRKVRTGITNVNTSLSENISGIKLTQVFNQEKKQCDHFREINNELKHNYSRQILVYGIFRPSIYAIYVLTIVLLFYIGGKQIIDSNFVLTSGLIVTFYAFIEKLFTPIQNLAEQFNVLQSALAAGERIYEVLNTKCEIEDQEEAIEVDHLDGEIEFKNVWFAYEEDDWILKDVSFKVHAKENVALVGATGAGKTTILSLIVRNYDIQKGQILIDGKDIKSYKITSLRKHIGQMLQDVFLFSGTIESNITLRDETITHEEVVEACEFVNADKVIAKLPEKYNDIVRERGKNFSSGERQLISFARVISHKPNIMILDEATANIDTETEALIQDSLKKIMNIGTMLIVAHRLSTIQHCDKIIVLRKGRIIEMGNHFELLEKKGYYYNLYRLQYKDNEKVSVN